MKRNKVFFWLSISILVLFTMACSLSDTIGNLFSSVKLDSEVYRSEAGGFSYRIPVDYEQEEYYGSVQILAEGADTDTGPVYMLMGSSEEEFESIADLQDQMVDNWGFDDYSTPKSVRVAGHPGLQTDFSVDDDGDEIVGRIVVVLISPTQQFVMLGGGSPEIWKNEGKVFSKILGSIKFFEPDPDAE